MKELDRSAHGGDDVEALVAAAVAGDRGAREALARRCRPRVRRTVYLAVGPGPDVEDLTQATLTQVFRNLDRFRGEASFWVWVDRIATNEVRMHFRRRGWRQSLRYEEDRADHQQGGPGPDERAAQQRSVRRLARHLATLRPTLRLPLVLSPYFPQVTDAISPEFPARPPSRPEAIRTRYYPAAVRSRRAAGRGPRLPSGVGSSWSSRRPWPSTGSTAHAAWEDQPGIGIPSCHRS